MYWTLLLAKHVLDTSIGEECIGRPYNLSKEVYKSNFRQYGQMKSRDGKVAKHCVFSNDLWFRRSKNRLATAAGAEPAGQMRDEKLHAVVARSTFRSQNAQNTPGSDHFWKLRCRKSHVVVAQSTFRSQNAQNKPGPDHFWKLRCRKKCTPLWHEAHFHVKMCKRRHTRTTFGN